MVSFPRSVVFDCDGTIADTESPSARAWQQTLAEFGYQATDEELRGTIGHPFARTWQQFADRAGLADRDAFRAALRTRFEIAWATDPVYYPDTVHTMRTLVAAGVLVAVASSSSRAHVERVLAAGGLDELVSAIVGADDVDRHKPDPAPYRQAVRLLGTHPGQAAAVEDTSVGVASAMAAGLFTVGIVREHGRADELAAADRVVDELTPAALVRKDVTSG